MATVVRGRVPTEELALSYTHESCPGLTIECERIVKSGQNTVMPLLWIRNGDREEIDATLEEDGTVEDASCISAFDNEFLYKMEWIEHVHLLVYMLTNGEASILDAYGSADRWKFRVLYPDRAHLGETHEFAAEHGLTLEIDSVRGMEGEPAGRYGLTDGQYKALVRATNRGYYEVPRGTTLEDLADDLNISHQALSEHLRRGTGALIEDTLLIGADCED